MKTNRTYTKKERRERLVQVYLQPDSKVAVSKIAKGRGISLSKCAGELIEKALTV